MHKSTAVNRCCKKWFTLCLWPAVSAVSSLERHNHDRSESLAFPGCMIHALCWEALVAGKAKADPQSRGCCSTLQGYGCTLSAMPLSPSSSGSAVTVKVMGGCRYCGHPACMWRGRAKMRMPGLRESPHGRVCQEQAARMSHLCDPEPYVCCFPALGPFHLGSKLSCLSVRLNPDVNA